MTHFVNLFHCDIICLIFAPILESVVPSFELSLELESDLLSLLIARVALEMPGLSKSTDE